ncbi:MAG: hypothetical protein ACTSV1_00065 [Alphaproteobacteria bacterium]
MMSEMDFSFDPATVMTVMGTVIIVLIVYYYFLVGAVLEMLRADAPTVMLVFAYLSLIPVPPFLILGILNLIIWHCVRKDMPRA